MATRYRVGRDVFTVMDAPARGWRFAHLVGGRKMRVFCSGVAAPAITRDAPVTMRLCNWCDDKLTLARLRGEAVPLVVAGDPVPAVSTGEVLDALNGYSGPDVWGDVIAPLGPDRGELAERETGSGDWFPLPDGREFRRVGGVWALSR